MKNKAYVLNIIFGVTVQAISQSGAKAELRQAQKNLKDFIDKVNADEGTTVLKRDYGKETSYGAAELTEAEKNDIIKQEEEQRKRAAEIRRIKEKVIPLQKTDNVIPRQKVHRQGTKEYYDRQNYLKNKKKYDPGYVTISDDEIIELVKQYK